MHRGIECFTVAAEAARGRGHGPTTDMPGPAATRSRRTSPGSTPAYREPTGRRKVLLKARSAKRGAAQADQTGREKRLVHRREGRSFAEVLPRRAATADDG
ncbi:MAG: hypothetical protein AMXMBFR47_07850 [Planctomycetota bacterium]